jgi:predicted RNase H-like nuclease (RuvC/YqgF family)
MSALSVALARIRVNIYDAALWMDAVDGFERIGDRFHASRLMIMFRHVFPAPSRQAHASKKHDSDKDDHRSHLLQTTLHRLRQENEELRRQVGHLVEFKQRATASVKQAFQEQWKFYSESRKQIEQLRMENQHLRTALAEWRQNRK